MKFYATRLFQNCMFVAITIFIFFSCTDEDLFSEVLSQEIEENLIESVPDETNGGENNESSDESEGESENENQGNGTDEDGDQDNGTDENEDPGNETDENNPPMAVADAEPRSGTAPLEVQFNGGESSGDNGITSYLWDFMDGSTSSAKNPSHTFTNAGDYEVNLTVTDDEGLEHSKNVIIIVSETNNEAPVAVATADILTGNSPVQVNFIGIDSHDDKGITSYYWDFPDDSSSSPNPTRTFDTPGVYDVTLTVTDQEGLQDTANLTINVNSENNDSSDNEQISCNTGGSRANEKGSKIWCWENIQLPVQSNGRESFSNSQLALDSKCNENQVVQEGNRLKFRVDLNSPITLEGCDSNNNYRAEIRTMPWNVDHAPGTEQWIGFNYRFSDTYKADPTGNWVFYQSHEGTLERSPLISLQIDGRSQSRYKIGEVVIVNASQEKGSGPNTIYGTDIVPMAGDDIDVVIHVVWGNANTGLLEVWLNGVKVVNEQTTRTVRGSTNVGGNSKFGIYKHRWRNDSGIQDSEEHGITDVETSMGALRMILRKPGDSGYRTNSYEMVAPQ